MLSMQLTSDQDCCTSGSTQREPRCFLWKACTVLGVMRRIAVAPTCTVRMQLPSAWDKKATSHWRKPYWQMHVCKQVPPGCHWCTAGCHRLMKPTASAAAL